MSEAHRQETLQRIIEAGLAGLRCPTRDEVSHTFVTDLVRTGDIRVEIYAGNWRVIEILTGEHKGLRTAERPGKRVPAWKVMDARGTRKFDVPKLKQPPRKKPSAPRALRADELR